MKWRVLLEVTDAGVTVAREISVGNWLTSDASPETIGLTLAEGKSTLAGLQQCLGRPRYRA
jgi:hypothetical protein